MTTKEDIFSEEELEAIAETKQSVEERKKGQAEFLDKLSEQTEVEVVETEPS